MDKSEVSSVEEIKNMIKVRNELGWGTINDLMKWLNPGGNRDSLICAWRQRQEIEYLIKSRNALGWGEINEFIKSYNPGGLRDSLLR